MSVLESLEVRSAIRSLRDVIPSEELNALEPTGPGAVYTTLATVWMMILQRLGGGLSLQAVVKMRFRTPKKFFLTANEFAKSHCPQETPRSVTLVGG